jgi:prepilin-type N-terminal cleavage/methylation domain-containing protein
MINRIRKIIVRRGFTLIETLFAVLILTLAITGPLSIASNSLGAALIAKDQTTAYYLAQDAVEYVRFARDSACLGQGSSPCLSTTWLSTLSAGGCVSSATSSSCTVDSALNTVTACPGNVCPVLNYDSSSGLYTYRPTGGTITPSIFTRAITITTPVGTNPGEASLLVTVQWKDIGGIARSVSEREDLFNWQ